MTYDELKKIASPHIRETEKIPSNSLLLLTQLHIPYKTERQCEIDFKEQISPLKNTPAFLYLDVNGGKTLYFNTNTQYYNFYIYHEIAHYLLGHESDSPQNEIDADMLACILISPVENLPSYLKSARDLSTLCGIPIDKAEMYWQEIKSKFFKHHKKIWISGCIIGAVILSAILLLCLNNYSGTPKNNEKTNNAVSPIFNNNNQDSSFYITTSGTHYHLSNCKHIKYKNNIINISGEEADKFNIEPCNDCIR